MRILTVIVTLASAALMFMAAFAIRPWGDSFFRVDTPLGVALWSVLCALAVGLVAIGIHAAISLVRARHSRA